MNHYTEEDLLLYVLSNPEPHERMAVETHAAECEICRHSLAAIRAMDEALRDQATWAEADERPRKHERPPQLSDRVMRLEREVAAAEKVLVPVSEFAIRFANSGITRNPAMQTVGGVRALCSLAERLRQRQPAFAVSVAEAAISVATKLKLQGDRWAPAMMTMALREHAAALFITGGFRDAERAALRAEDACSEDPYATPHDFAMIWLIRANICVETERLAEGSLLAAGAAKQFRKFGDTHRALTADMIHGNAMFFASDYRAAAGVYDAIAATARLTGDSLLLARAALNAANAYEKLGEYVPAQTYYAEALALWDELGANTEKTRTEWGLASIKIRNGEFGAGIAGLHDVLREFEATGAANDAALVRLMLAEVLLATGQPDDVPDLVRGIVVTFAAEGMMRSANMALAYLREAVETGEATPAVVRHVRTYLENLPTRPELVFSPIS